MAKEPKQPELNTQPEFKPYNVYAMGDVVQLGLGLDLIGSKMSVSSKNATLEISDIGIFMTSRKTKERVLLPWANVKGVKLL
jgi:hypothetical protein